MNFDRLRYFVTAARTQHIGQASKILGISPSAISHSIRDIERELGSSLFVKAGKNVNLTEVGARFAYKAEQLLAEAEQLKIEFRSKTLPLEGLIRIGATHGLSNYFVAPVLEKLREKNPGLSLRVHSLISAEVVEMVADGQIDVGVCFSPNPHPKIAVSHEIPTPLKIAVKPRHPALKASPKTLTRILSGLPMIGPVSVSGIEVCENHPELERTGVISSTTLTSNSYEVSAGYIRRSFAWGLMPEILVKPLRLQVVELEGLKANARVAILSPKGRVMPKIILDALLSALAPKQLSNRR